jgi:thioredoxin 1
MKVLKFSASWCIPCRQLSQVIENITDLPAEIVEIDVDEAQEVAIRYGIRGVPTLVVVDDKGIELRRRSGTMSENDFKAFLAA